MGFPELPELPELPSLPDIPNPADGPQGAMCQDLESKLDRSLGTLLKAKNAMNSPLKTVMSQMTGAVGAAETPAGEMGSALSSAGSSLGNAIPKAPNGVDEVKSLLENCGILEAELPKVSAKKIMGNFSTTSTSGLLSTIGNIFDTFEGLVEFPIAKGIDAINFIAQQLGLIDLVSAMDGYLDCLSSMCGSSVSPKLDYANTLMDQMYINDNGELDQGRLFSESGISNQQIINITDIGDTISSAKTTAATEIQEAGTALADAAKSIKTGSLSDAIADRITIPWA